MEKQFHIHHIGIALFHGPSGHVKSRNKGNRQNWSHKAKHN